MEKLAIIFIAAVIAICALAVEWQRSDCEKNGGTLVDRECWRQGEQL